MKSNIDFVCAVFNKVGTYNALQYTTKRTLVVSFNIKY